MCCEFSGKIWHTIIPNYFRGWRFADVVEELFEAKTILNAIELLLCNFHAD